MVEPERVSVLVPGAPAPGNHVLYWMQRSQRARENPALSFALAEARRHRLPLVVLFVLLDYPGATAVHYRFMLEGLRETAAELRRRGVAFALRRAGAVGASAGGGASATGADPVPVVAAWAAGGAGAPGAAALVVTDRGYLRHERAWRRSLAEALAPDSRPFLQVDGDTVVPADAASLKLEWSAATLRRKIEGAVRHYLAPAPDEAAAVDAGPLGADAGDGLFAAYDSPAAPAYPGDRSAEQSPPFRPGTRAALAAFDGFLERLDRYDSDRNDPNLEGTSGMSPWLHFGQVSPAALARGALDRGGPGAAPYVEQLVVRRELAVNFCLREPGYDRYGTAVPEWARGTLAEAAADRRSWIFSRDRLEAAATHDPYWNAAQNQLVRSGIIHNYMRMYWGKKILEWSADPETAFRAALYLNDRYALDGRDPDGYAGVAWCFGRHDRPWARRAIFGTVRYMNDAGLRRKFDAEAYARRWSG